MKRMKVFASILLVLIVLGALPVNAQSEQESFPDSLTDVHDVDDLLSDDQEFLVNAALELASEQTGIPICAYVFFSDYSYGGREKYFGQEFLADRGLSDDDPLVLLVVSATHSEIFYDIYTYGDAYRKINEKEIDYILDDSRVYHNIKQGNIADGLCAYAELSAEAYMGRLGVSWVLILIGSLIIGAIVGAISAKSVLASYKRKKHSTAYPLDRFATLDLTNSDDREIGRFVTTTIISSGGRGGRGGGGGSRMGGGGGHRGGR